MFVFRIKALSFNKMIFFTIYNSQATGSKGYLLTLKSFYLKIKVHIYKNIIHIIFNSLVG